MEFAGIQKTSLIDFPDKIATVLFTPGCNLRCPFCHNWRLVLEPKGPYLSEEEALQILESRKRFVDAVVITGGEPTMHMSLPRFLKKLKEKGFYVKVDTNGFFPGVLEKSMSFLDYVALDVKTSLDRYRLLGANNLESLMHTIEILKNSCVEYEFRCTVVPGFVDEKAVKEIGKMVKGAKRFVFQQFAPWDTLDKSFNKVKPYSLEVISYFAEMMKNYTEEALIRT